MTKELTQFLNCNLELLSLLDSMVKIEEEKRRSLLEHDSEKTESTVQAGQALYMQLKNIEEKRMTIGELCGFKDLSITQILERLSDEDKKEFDPVFTKLLHSADLIKQLNSVSMSIVNMELRVLGNYQNSGSGTYSSSGKKTGATYNKSTFTGKI